MNTCPVCQARVTTPGAVFCQVCGSKLSDVPETLAIEAVPPDRQNTVPPPAQSQSAQRIAPQQAQTPNMPHMTAGQNNPPGKKIPWIPILVAGYALLIVIVAVVVIAVVVARKGSGTTAKKKAESPVTSHNTQENGYKVYGDDMQDEAQKLDITFKCLPEMKDLDYSSMKIQINDFILDFSLQRSMTVAEVIEIVEASSLNYTVTRGMNVYEPYISDTLVWPAYNDTGIFIGEGSYYNEQLFFGCEENKDLSFGLTFENITNSKIEIKDAILTDIIDESDTPFIWFPGGIRQDGEGLNYKNVPKLFPEYRVIEKPYATDPRDDYSEHNDSLKWHSQYQFYSFTDYEPNSMGYSDSDFSDIHDFYTYCFFINETTKEVVAVTVEMRESFLFPPDNTYYDMASFHAVKYSPLTVTERVFLQSGQSSGH